MLLRKNIGCEVVILIIILPASPTTSKIFTIYFLAFHGSGALSGKMWLVRIVENNKIDAYFRSG